MKEYARNVRASQLSLVDVPAISGDAAETPAVTKSGAPAGTASASALPLEAQDGSLAEAEKEYAAGRVDAPLWTWAVEQAGGDKAQARRIYLDGRAIALRAAKRNEDAPPPTPVVRAPPAPVVKARRNAPELGSFAREGRNAPAAKETSRTRRGSARPNRRQVILAAGVLGTVVVITGWVALRSWSSPAQQQSVAKPAAPVNVARTAPVAANTSGPARENVPGEDFAGRVQALEKAGNWNLLVIYAAEWTRKQPGNAEPWKRLSMGYIKLRQFGDALDAATKAVQLAPEDFLQWQNLGQINVALQRPEEALLAFRRAEALNDRDLVSLVQDGILNTQLGRLPDAKIAFAKALALGPEDVQALCGAAAIAQKEGRVKDADAMARQVTSLGGRCRDSNGSESVRAVASGRAK
jgi:tetratricopeptide (TPR) repeat protein